MPPPTQHSSVCGNPYRNSYCLIHIYFTGNFWPEGLIYRQKTRWIKIYWHYTFAKQRESLMEKAKSFLCLCMCVCEFFFVYSLFSFIWNLQNPINSTSNIYFLHTSTNSLKKLQTMEFEKLFPPHDANNQKFIAICEGPAFIWLVNWLLNQIKHNPMFPFRNHKLIRIFKERDENYNGEKVECGKVH